MYHDLISKQHAIDALISQGRETESRYLEFDRVITESDVIEMIELLEPDFIQDWIPCSKALPKEKGEYLVTYHPCYWDDVKPELKVGIDTFRGKTTWAKKKYQRVIAWMEKPKPYEIGE